MSKQALKDEMNFQGYNYLYRNEEKHRQNKTAFQWNAYRPLANGMCCCGQYWRRVVDIPGPILLGEGLHTPGIPLLVYPSLSIPTPVEETWDQAYTPPGRNIGPAMHTQPSLVDRMTH